MRLGLLTDLHLREGGAGRWHNPRDFAGVQPRFAAALQRFAAAGVDGVALLGDLSDDADAPAALEAVATARQRARVPVLAIAGNHDDPSTAAALDESNRAAAAALGARVLDAPVADGTVVALAPPDAAPALLLTHFPVLALRDELERRELKHAGDHPERERLQRWVHDRGGAVVVVAGHLHVRAAFADGPALHLQIGPLLEHPFDATLLALANGEVRVSAASLPGGQWDTETRLVADERRWRYEGGRWISA